MKIEPENRELWNMFQSCQKNEMIITKSGRCLFPVLKFKIILDEENSSSPDPEFYFSYGLGIERIDSFKWKYRHHRWYSIPVTPTNTPSFHESSMHIYEPEHSSVTWTQIRNEGLNFSKVKLTNRKGISSYSSNALATKSCQSENNSNSNYFSLSSFGNYAPVVYILDWNCFIKNHQNISNIASLNSILKSFDQEQLILDGSLRKIRVHECAFIAVTHYQNELITHLKKHNNPHAKGFILTNDNMSTLASPTVRGKPGRKRRSNIYPDSDNEIQPNFFNLSEDVYIASLALEKMSNVNIPRSEIAKNNSNIDDLIESEPEFEKVIGTNFLNYKNKLR